jgi:nucleotide-binding universal stress UspA family protein
MSNSSNMTKLRILILTDFSNLSHVALKYAARMSHTVDCDYTIVNVVRVDGIPKSNMRLKNIEKSVLDASNHEGEILLKELMKEARVGSRVQFKAIKGHTVAETIERYVKKNPTELVVMGSQGASSLKKLRLGGTAVSVIEMCPSPVLTVPKWAGFKNFDTVVYASDLKNVQKELDTIVPFAKLFKTTIHMVHVVASIDKQVESRKLETEKILQKVNYDNISLKILIDENVPQAIDGFIKSSKADLLTTFTHELTLYDKLFGLSVTRTLAYQGNIPLLAFKRRIKKD